MAAVSTKVSGFGSCGCDHWRDARTMSIIGWVVLSLAFALFVLALRARARRRALADDDGGVTDMAAKRRRDVDGAVSWDRGVVRIAAGSIRWRRDGDPDAFVVEPGSVRRGPAVGASQFPFTVSVTARIGDAEVTFAVRPGDDVAMLESDRKMAAAAGGSSWAQ